MKKIALAAMLIACSAVHAAPKVVRPNSTAAAALNAQSKATLGVSVRALSFLFEADPNSFSRRESIDPKSWADLQALQRAGLVRVAQVGQNGAYVQIERTAIGDEVMRSLYGP